MGVKINILLSYSLYLMFRGGMMILIVYACIISRNEKVFTNNPRAKVTQVAVLSIGFIFSTAAEL
jgi:energy-converting hydrogenase Eha subunit C